MPVVVIWEAGNNPDLCFRTRKHTIPDHPLSTIATRAFACDTQDPDDRWLVYLTWTTLFVSAAIQADERGSTRSGCRPARPKPGRERLRSTPHSARSNSVDIFLSERCKRRPIGRWNTGDPVFDGLIGIACLSGSEDVCAQLQLSASRHLCCAKSLPHSLLLCKREDGGSRRT